MSTFFRAFLIGATLVALAHEARAQIIDVPGDYATVQEAIDAADPGSTIRIAGGTWGSITITKPLTLLGPALFEGQGNGPPPSYWLAPITLSGPGSGRVVLSDISTGREFIDGFSSYSSVPPGIEGGGSTSSSSTTR